MSEKLTVVYDLLVCFVCTLSIRYILVILFIILTSAGHPCSSLIEIQTLSSQAESFGKIISQLAAQEGVTEDKIMLSLSDINILGYDTPISTRLSVADIIGEFPHGYQFEVKQDQLALLSFVPFCPNWKHGGKRPA